jgi:hypothetical protein
MPRGAIVFMIARGSPVIKACSASRQRCVDEYALGATYDLISTYTADHFLWRASV